MTTPSISLLLRQVWRIDPKVRRQSKHYVLQATLAAVTLASILVINDALSNIAVATGIAASSFLVFIGPSAPLGQTRRVIGGHLVGGIVGLGIGALLRLTGVHGGLLLNLGAAFGVGVGIIVMAATDTEHPPAAGTILGLMLGSEPLACAVVVVLSACAITLSRRLLRPWLIDLI